MKVRNLNSINNNKGVTLIEIIIGVVLLAIASVMLVSGFVATANIVNRANHFKNASAAASSSIELQEKQESTFSDVDIDFQTTEKPNTAPKQVVIKGEKSTGAPVQFSINGEYISAKDGTTQLTYREFLPGAFDFNVPAIETP